MSVSFQHIIEGHCYFNKNGKWVARKKSPNAVVVEDCLTGMRAEWSEKQWNLKGLEDIDSCNDPLIKITSSNDDIVGESRNIEDGKTSIISQQISKSIFNNVTMSNLTIGTKINLSDGSTAVIKSKLGEGGQGVVYLVTLSNGMDMALKCYTSPPKSGFFDNLKKISAQKAPSPAFLWPKYIAMLNGEECGYVMDLMPQGYYDFGDFFSAGYDGKVKANFSSFGAKVQAAINICNAFRQLHIQGLSYQDLNDGSFLINPNNGDVRICDNDNVCANNHSVTYIMGKSRYMAAEVINGETFPNTNSDRLSLAIILYRLFMLDHPFEGESIIKIPCLTNDVERRKYGKEAVFVYDPSDDSNRPNPYIHRNSCLFWNYCSESLKQKFQKALSHQAIINPLERVSAKEWKELFLALRRNLIVCPNSPKDKDHDFLSDGIVHVCPRCKDQIVINTSLHFSDGTDYIVTPHKLIYIGDEMNPIARGVTKVNDNGIKELGLQNMSNYTWNVQTPKGNIKQVEPQKAMPLRNGMQIRFRGDCACKVNVF